MDSTPAEPKSELNLNKTEYNEDDDEVKVKYKGVRQRKSGKFGSEIIDPNKRRSVWLGTFDSAIEAAKAYDKAAFEMRGPKASLNFPLDFGISPEESNAVVHGGRKRTGDGCVTVAVVKTSPQHNAPINVIEVGPSSPPSSQRQSTPRENFKWTDEWLCAMCGILNKHIANNGRNCPFNWADHQLELENICNHKFNTILALRSKYDAMRVRHNLWKSLKSGETGLRWNESTGKLDCSDDWWEKKIKENPDFKRFRRNQPSRELQVAWDLLFDNVVSNGVDCVDLNTSNQVHHVNLEDKDDGVDCVDLNTSNQVHHVNLEDKDDHVDVSSERTLESSQYGNQETEEATSISKFGNLAANQGDGFKPSEKIVKTSLKPESTRIEWMTTESEKATMFKEFMTRQNATQQRALKIPKTSNVYQVGDFSISASVGVVNRMVEEGLMTSCSELWCFAVNLFEDDVKRELFMSLPDDVGRLAWLQYKKNLGN